MAPTISFAVVGLVIGEAASMIVSLIAIKAHFVHVVPKNYGILLPAKMAAYPPIIKNLLTLAVPLSLNRIIINFLQSLEAIFIPNRLLDYGYNNTTALSVYGILTGMSLPLILFPSAITNSICVLLLPIVSEADAAENTGTIKKAVHKSICYGFFLGIIFTAFFCFSHTASFFFISRIQAALLLAVTVKTFLLPFALYPTLFLCVTVPSPLIIKLPSPFVFLFFSIVSSLWKTAGTTYVPVVFRNLKFKSFISVSS